MAFENIDTLGHGLERQSIRLQDALEPADRGLAGGPEIGTRPVQCFGARLREALHHERDDADHHE